MFRILLLIRIFRKLNPRKVKVIQRQQKDKKEQQELILHYQAMAKVKANKSWDASIEFSVDMFPATCRSASLLVSLR